MPVVCYAPGAHPRILRTGRHQQSLDAQRDESIGYERAGLPPGAETGKDDCGSGADGANSGRAPFGFAQGRSGREGKGEIASHA